MMVFLLFPAFLIFWTITFFRRFVNRFSGLRGGLVAGSGLVVAGLVVACSVGSRWGVWLVVVFGVVVVFQAIKKAAF